MPEVGLDYCADCIHLKGCDDATRWDVDDYRHCDGYRGDAKVGMCVECGYKPTCHFQASDMGQCSYFLGRKVVVENGP